MGLCSKCGAKAGFLRSICASCSRLEEEALKKMVVARRKQLAFDRMVYAQPSQTVSSGFGLVSGIRLENCIVVDEVDDVSVEKADLKYLILNPTIARERLPLGVTMPMVPCARQ
jgi:hypothetical protein